MQSNLVPPELCSVELRRYDIAASGIIYKNFPLIRELVFGGAFAALRFSIRKRAACWRPKLAHVHKQAFDFTGLSLSRRDKQAASRISFVSLSSRFEVEEAQGRDDNSIFCGVPEISKRFFVVAVICHREMQHICD